MSLSLLLEKYDVSTEEGLAKALGEIEKEESEVDEALSGALSKACALEGRLRTASQAYTKLGEMKNDAQVASDMVDRTAALAKDVSAKVRQLDLARSRVAECQRRVHDLIDLQLCSAGVEAAIKAHDYETGAGHVARFLSMDPGSVAAARARGAPDPRNAMARAADTLREHLVRKFEEASRKDDAAAVERLFKLFPQIGRADEGVDLFAKYIAAQLEVSIKRASIIPSASLESAVFADALTRALELACAAVERARRALANSAPAHLPRALAIIQPVVSSGCARTCAELERTRPIDPSNPRRAPASPVAAEPVLVELATAHNTIALYFAFLRRKTQMDAASADDKTKQACLDAVEKIITNSDLTRTAQDLLGHYLKLERYFLEENVSKALKMATPQPGATTSNLVDDIFFIARKAIRRSVTTGSLEGVCTVLNEAGALLERGAHALRRWLRPPPDPAPLPPPPALQTAAAPQTAFTARFNKDEDAQRDLFLAHMNEAEAGAEWSEQLAADACAWAAPLATTPPTQDKLNSCAGGLAAAAAAYRAALDLATAGLRAALQPKLAAWAKHVAAPNADSDSLEEDAEALPAALEVLSSSLRSSLSPRVAEDVLAALLAELATRAEGCILRNVYDREGGLAVERRVRRAAAWAGSSAPAARERLARLTHAAALLALERAHHAHTALAPPLARDILARRYIYMLLAAARERLARLTHAAALLALERAHHAHTALAPPLARDILARRYIYMLLAAARERLARLTHAAALLALERAHHAHTALAPPLARDILARRYIYMLLAAARERLARLTHAAALLALERAHHAHTALAPPLARDILARRYIYMLLAAARERLARLTHAAALLALERAHHAHTALAPPLARDILARRYIYMLLAAARERLARLTHAAALLALERAHHAHTALAPPLARDILARRSDFKIEEIKRLKL